MRGQELLWLISLKEEVDRWRETFGLGRRWWLDLGPAWVHEIEILFLDRQTTGLDPTSCGDM